MRLIKTRPILSTAAGVIVAAAALPLRINGTPGFVIGEQILHGATDLKTLQSLISEARQRR